MSCLLSCFGRGRQKSQTSIEEYNAEERKISRTRFFAVFIKKKNEKAETTTSNQSIVVSGNEEKNEEAENLLTGQVSVNEEQDRAKTAEELEEEAIAKAEAKLGLVDEKMPNYKAIMSGRYARYGDLGDPDYVPPSRPVEVDIVFQVRTSKIIVNPFVTPGDEFRLVEKKIDAMDTDRPVKNFLYELFTPLYEPVQQEQDDIDHKFAQQIKN